MTFVDRQGTTLDVVINGSPTWCSPKDNEAYFIARGWSFEMPISEIPAFIEHMQAIYNEAHTHCDEDEPVDDVNEGDVVGNDKYIEAMNRHSDAMEELAHQMSIADLGGIRDAVESLRSLRDVEPKSWWE